MKTFKVYYPVTPLLENENKALATTPNGHQLSQIKYRLVATISKKDIQCREQVWTFMNDNRELPRSMMIGDVIEQSDSDWVGSVLYYVKNIGFGSIKDNNRKRWEDNLTLAGNPLVFYNNQVIEKIVDKSDKKDKVFNDTAFEEHENLTHDNENETTTINTEVLKYLIESYYNTLKEGTEEEIKKRFIKQLSKLSKKIDSIDEFSNRAAIDMVDVFSNKEESRLSAIELANKCFS